MDSLKLEFARRDRGKSRADMARAIGKTENSYNKKERGEISFSDEEKVIVARELGLTLQQTNEIFFDSQLPLR